MPAAVHAPDDVVSLAGVVAQANRHRQPLSPRGGGTKWLPDAASLPAASILSTASLAPIVDHCAGDLTATVSAGMTLDQVNAVLRSAGQWLPLDPPHAGRATIGGIIAANDSGPRRHRYGAPRDLIIGIEMVRADGTVAKAGGKVVKNVAGYDLARMMCGSYGSLAVLTAATFKLVPVPPVSRTVVAALATARAAADLALSIAALPVTPSALEMESPPDRLYVRFDSTERAADVQAAEVVALCRAKGATATVHADDEARGLWRDYETTLWTIESDAMLTRVGVLPSEVGDIVDGAGAAAIGGRAALGVLYLRWRGTSDAAAGWLSRLRALVARRGGTAVVVRAPAGWSDQIDPWGPEPGSVTLMRAMKARFDPNNTLNPGLGPWRL